MCFINGIRLINHSPSQKTVEPVHDETNIPTKNIKSSEVTNPSPVSNNIYKESSAINIP